MASGSESTRSSQEVVARQKFTYPVGDTYDGEWSNEGRKHGLGHLTLVNGTRYMGQFQNGFCHGHGVSRFPDGSVYEGEFQNGKYSGFGVFTRNDGMRYEGKFNNGGADGEGLITFPDGTNGRPRQEGHFIGNELVERKRVIESVKKAQHAAKIARGINI
ncbi:MORN repeat-containing protein 4 [Acropora cervicornis]|uniref:MORN repeat-containing protein 4 n=1 Tax=Acropora cervicornis TaxID=6130 RepID=A0AAD9QSZ0_ACRCE|nr:MORN repeat-containing protein 4 [Acropora cervicornis]